MRRLKQTGKSNEAKQERLSILCFWQMLTWFSEKMPQEIKTGLLKERWNKYLTSWHTNIQKTHKKMSQVSMHSLFITEYPKNKDLQKQVHEVHTTSSASFIVSHFCLTVSSRASFSFSDGICLNWCMYFSKLLHRFSKAVLEIPSPLPNKTKVNFDQHIWACLSFCFGKKNQGPPLHPNTLRLSYWPFKC